MLTTEGGIDIEELAERSPDAIARLHVDPLMGFQPFHARRLASWPASPIRRSRSRSSAIVALLYQAFVESEAMLCEINPLIVTTEGEVRALDAKVTLDDNALYRHPALAALRDVSTAAPQEALAREKGLAYVKLDGDIGILGNGAGLVMSTLDVVAQAGGRPANFCDVGGGAQADVVVGALEVITADPVEAILVQHLRRHHPRRRGGEGAPRGARADGHRGAGRRPDRRHRGGRGASPARRALAGERPRRAHDARGGAARRRARGVAMAIIVDTDTRLVVQGITGREGTFHTLRNRDYGTNVVAGVTPGKGGESVDGIPVFDSVRDAVDETDANTAMVFVPARFAADAVYEAVDAGIETVIAITEGIPAHDMLRVYNYIRPRGVTMVGPNCPGVLSPGKANVGIIPAEIFSQGPVGLVSRSGTLTYQIGNELTQLGIGQSTIVGIGGDPVVGSSFIDVLARFEDDPETEYVIMVGEIGGSEEEKAAGVHRRGDDEAGRGLHRGVHGPAREDDGACRRDHLRLRRDGGGEEGRSRGSRRPGRAEPDRGGAARRRARRRPRLTRAGPSPSEYLAPPVGAGARLTRRGRDLLRPRQPVARHPARRGAR